MSNNDKNIEKFVHRIIDLQHNKRETKISDNDLKKIAEEIGLSPSEWETVLQIYENHFIRANGFIKFSNWEDAIVELEHAITIKPHNTDCLYLLAYCHRKLFIEQKQQQHIKSAEKYARTCTKIDPSNLDALKLLSDIKKESKAKSSKPAIIATIIIIVILFLIYVIGNSSSQEEISKIDSTKNETQREKTTPQSNKTPEDTSPDIPVEFITDENAEGLIFQLQSSSFIKLNKSFSYRLKTDITTKGIEVSALKIKCDLIDINDNIVVSKLKKITDEYSIFIRNNDIIPVDLLIYEKTEEIPEIKKALFTIHYIEKENSNTEYTPSKKINFKWLSEKPANYNLEVYERYLNYNHGPNTSYCKIIFEVKNTGNLDISQLKFELQWEDNKGKTIQSKDFYINSTSNPKIKKSQKRIKGGTWSIKNGKNAEGLKYKIIVSEIK